MSDQQVSQLLAQYREARWAQPEEARRALIEAEALCRSTANDRDLVDVLKGLAQLARDAGRPAQALVPYDEAVAICLRLEMPLLLAHTVRHLGDLQMELGRADLAGPCFDEALALYRTHPEREDLDFANALRPAALHREAVGDVAGATRLWTDARDLYMRVGIERAVVECDRHLADLAVAH